MLAEMKRFIDSGGCRRKILLKYFGEDYPKTNCKSCDNCLSTNTQEEEDLTKEAKLLFKVMTLCNDMYGDTMIVNILRGSKSKKIKTCFLSSKYYGAGSKRSEVWWKQFVRLMVSERYIRECSIAHGHGFTLAKTKKTVDWIKDKNSKMVLVLPQSMQTGDKTEQVKGKTDNKPKLKTKTKTNTKDSVHKSYVLYQNENNTVAEIAEERKITIKTVEDHLLQAYMRDYKFDLERIGLTDDVYKAIRKVLLVVSDTALLRNIKKRVEGDVSYLCIKIAQCKLKEEVAKMKNQVVKTA